MGWTAIIATLLLHGSSPQLPVEERKPPPPRPAPKPRPTKVVVFTCIMDDPLPPPPLMRECEGRAPEIRGVSFLRPCPQWIDKIVAEADRL